MKQLRIPKKKKKVPEEAFNRDIMKCNVFYMVACDKFETVFKTITYKSFNEIETYFSHLIYFVTNARVPTLKYVFINF